jgi:hypothetical protein
MYGFDKIYIGPQLEIGRYCESLGLDGPGIESRCGRDFPHPSRAALGPTQPPLEQVPELSHR